MVLVIAGMVCLPCSAIIAPSACPTTHALHAFTCGHVQRDSRTDHDGDTLKHTRYPPPLFTPSQLTSHLLPTHSSSTRTDSNTQPRLLANS